MIFALHCNRFGFAGLECHKVIAGIHCQNFSYDFIHAGEIVVETAHQKIHVHRRSAFKVSQGVNKQTPLKHEVLCVLRACQPAQKFLLKK